MEAPPTDPGTPAPRDDAAARRDWAQTHAAALRAQDDWMDRHGHPFHDIMVGPFAP